MRPTRLFTIGAYGFTPSTFFAALQNAAIDVFCDIRLRRGLRGPTHAFANSKRLQARLGELGIAYCHVRELAPSAETRTLQKDADARSKTQKRNRSELHPNFVAAYERQCLSGFNSRDFLSHINALHASVVLFCVEREPTACHRSILAKRICQDLRISVEHIVPCES